MGDARRADNGPVHADPRAETQVSAGVHSAHHAGLGGDGKVAARVTHDDASKRTGEGAGREYDGSGDHHREEELLHWASLLRGVGYLLKRPARPKSCGTRLRLSRELPPARAEVARRAPPAPAAG